MCEKQTDAFSLMDTSMFLKRCTQHFEHSTACWWHASYVASNTEVVKTDPPVPNYVHTDQIPPIAYAGIYYAPVIIV